MIAKEPRQGGFLQVLENKTPTSVRRRTIAVGIRVATVLVSTAKRRWPERGKGHSRSNMPAAPVAAINESEE
jgi:hypothetical protein